MKKSVAFMVSLAMIFMLVGTTVVASAEDSNSTTTTTNSGNSIGVTSTDDSNNESTTETPAEKAKAVEDRVKSRVAELKTKLTAAQTAKLKVACKPAQVKTSTLKTKLGLISTNRTTTYANITAKLTTLQTKVKAANVDTTDLDAQLTQLKTLVTTFNTDLKNYTQAVSDTAAIDCVADPTGFQASIEAARALHDKLLTDSAAIKTYLSDTIKPTLQTLKTQLEAAETESEKTTTTTTTGGTQ